MSDPVDGGICSRETSVALFQSFLTEMNAKWEYVLDPYLDTYDNVRTRSNLLFATVLFCSSKFFNVVNGVTTTMTDSFLQSRLCSLARSLATKMFAVGDRSTETMQAFYLLACWKDADDDISYIHSGYAFRILQDVDLEHSCGDRLQAARRRTWLALYRQDKQQSLFFMARRNVFRDSDDILPLIKESCGSTQIALPSDLMACCSGDLRRRQAQLSAMIQKSSEVLLPSLVDHMDAELRQWESRWHDQVTARTRQGLNGGASLDTALLHPGDRHNEILLSLWKSSVRLNVSSAILRQAVMASVSAFVPSDGQSALGLDLPPIGEIMTNDLSGLNDSIEGAFGTLSQLMKIPMEDLRRAPDAVVLLGPSAALFLCLLLCLPADGILGSGFQHTAVVLIHDTAQYFAHAIQSPNDTVALHSAFLESLVILLQPSNLTNTSNSHQTNGMSSNADIGSHVDPTHQTIDEATREAAHTLANGAGGGNYELSASSNMAYDDCFDQELHVQSLANLLDPNFWEMQPMATDLGI